MRRSYGTDWHAAERWMDDNGGGVYYLVEVYEPGQPPAIAAENESDAWGELVICDAEGFAEITIGRDWDDWELKAETPAAAMFID